MIVCSDASATGIRVMKMKNPIASGIIEERIGNRMVMVHSATFTNRRLLTGLEPRPLDATSTPPTMKPKLEMLSTIPQTSTDTSSNP